LITRDLVRKDILERACEKCNELVAEDEDCWVSFYRGQFVILHKECGDFMEHATKGLRGDNG